MSETPKTVEGRAALRRHKGQGYTSAVGEYTPAEFWEALDYIDELERELDAAIEQLQARLAEYGRHKAFCKMLDAEEPDAVCTCGFDLTAVPVPQCPYCGGLWRMAADSEGRVLAGWHDQERGEKAMITPDLHALAEETALKLCIGRAINMDDATPVIEYALAKLQQAHEAERTAGWEPITKAPMFVYGRDALIGQYVQGYGWKKVTIWESEWTRDQCIERGATHWWPHLRDLPMPILAYRSDMVCVPTQQRFMECLRTVLRDNSFPDYDVAAIRSELTAMLAAAEEKP